MVYISHFAQLNTMMFWAWTTCGCPSFSLFGRATLNLTDQKFMDSNPAAIAMFPQYFYCVNNRHKKNRRLVVPFVSKLNEKRNEIKMNIWGLSAYPSERKVSFHGRNSQVENLIGYRESPALHARFRMREAKRMSWLDHANHVHSTEEMSSAAMQYLTCEALSHCVLPTEILCSSTTSTWDSHPKPEESSLTQIRINCFFIFVF